MLENISLQNFITFKIQAAARYFFYIRNIEELRKAITFTKQKNLPWLVLGGGSNIVFTQDFEGVVLKIELMGIAVYEQDNNKILAEVGAGQNWHGLVLEMLSRGFFGLENLSLIPGTVGASPIQNIGAYGVEAADTIAWVEGLNLETLQINRLNTSECHFGYRNSIFKTQLKNKFIITKVGFELSKVANLKIHYGAITDTLAQMHITNPDPIHVSKAVIAIRQSKLPDPDILPNAGSFFKNPMILEAHFEKLKCEYTNIVGFNSDQKGYVKVAAGWLIEQAGWKGYKNERCGVYEKQALVLVNYNHATGQDIVNLAEQIIGSVQLKFGILLEAEVNMI